jgi:hypothetical protein
MNKSESVKELATALAKAQGEVENASKSSVNPHFKSKYADLAEIINTVRPVFSSHGLSILQSPSFADGVASVETTLMHNSGEWISGVASCTVTKNDAQGVGSATTYLRRYSLAALACIAQEDDDANAAVGKKPVDKPKPVDEPKISEAQFDELGDLILETKTDQVKFNQAMKIETLSQLPASKFDHAKMLLEKKRSVG